MREVEMMQLLLLLLLQGWLSFLSRHTTSFHVAGWSLIRRGKTMSKQQVGFTDKSVEARGHLSAHYKMLSFYGEDRQSE
jgi:hypothetical protein